MSGLLRRRMLLASSLDIYPDGAVRSEFVTPFGSLCFSAGNLQFNAAEGTHHTADGLTAQGTWRLSPTQYEYIGTGNDNISSTYDGWIDLFGWGTSGWYNAEDPYSVRYQPWDTLNTPVNSYYNRWGYGPSFNNPAGRDISGTWYDWGEYNAILNPNSGIVASPGTWRTPTNDEWDWIFFNRNNAYGKRGLANIAGTCGLVLLPDIWEQPAECLFHSGWENGYDTNEYSIEEWGFMESAGAVFIPAAGYRGTTNTQQIQRFGEPFSSTHYDGGGYVDTQNNHGRCYIPYFSDDHDINDGYSGGRGGVGERWYGRSVRLVHTL